MSKKNLNFLMFSQNSKNKNYFNKQNHLQNAFFQQESLFIGKEKNKNFFLNVPNNLLENSLITSGNKEILNKFAHSNNYSTKFFPTEKDNEYSELSYYNNNISNNPSNSNRNINQTPSSIDIANAKKKSLELDFKIKYKTEKCKYWEINQTCKFGDNVR